MTVSVAQQVLGLPTSVPASAYYTHEFLPATLPTKCPRDRRRSRTASRWRVSAASRSTSIASPGAFPIDGKRATQALTEISLRIRPGEFVAGVVGPSGCGKSTLMLSVTAGLLGADDRRDPVAARRSRRL